MDYFEGVESIKAKHTLCLIRACLFAESLGRSEVVSSSEAFGEAQSSGVVILTVSEEEDMGRVGRWLYRMKTTQLNDFQMIEGKEDSERFRFKTETNREHCASFRLQAGQQC